jgi:hypothetical protein
MPTLAGRIPSTCPDDDVHTRILERVRLNLNKTLAKSIVKAFEDDPADNFEQVLERTLALYRTRLANARQTAETQKLGDSEYYGKS